MAVGLISAGVLALVAAVLLFGLDHLITLDAVLFEPGRADLMQASEDLLGVIHAWAPLLSQSRSL